MKEHRLVMENGTMRFVYDDDLAALIRPLGARVERASHVEFDNTLGGWTADMSPSGGGVLGPFRSRQDGLDAERAWLREHLGL